MTKPTYDQAFWEQLWAKTLRDHPDKVASKSPNLHLMTGAESLPPGRALDAGCGHGAETLWLAARGWRVTAVDFSSTALDQARSMAKAAGAQLAARIDWQQADLATWQPQSAHYDLTICLYVHIAGSVEAMVDRMAQSVASHGSLLLVGHRPIDPSTGATTAASSQVQVSVAAAVAALDASQWQLLVAEERPRSIANSGVDAVILARRRA